MDKKYLIPPIPFLFERGLDMLNYTNEFIGWTLIAASILSAVWIYLPIISIDYFGKFKYVPLPKAVEKIFNKKIQQDKNSRKDVIPYEISRNYPLFGIREGASVMEPLNNKPEYPSRIDDYNQTISNDIKYTSLFMKRLDLKTVLKSIGN
jgi:hypothetical protein